MYFRSRFCRCLKLSSKEQQSSEVLNDTNTGADVGASAADGVAAEAVPAVTANIAAPTVAAMAREESARLTGTSLWITVLRILVGPSVTSGY
jgi:hypothetical protein